ncbi:hypothetical protein OG594_43180 [Streptomyces sp. NBC_01214]|uniref:hypothetical protein n=1 Tax=Streptomyces sp. NBC_01214 TaxID=2903777 RepID=UPI00224EDDD5|nr:hypothetical protein [Streptomyces sp. NBC_01214]MCX4808317.1 hypothetical protein [Streptomyces sp. NBC_01214]
MIALQSGGAVGRFGNGEYPVHDDHVRVVGHGGPDHGRAGQDPEDRGDPLADELLVVPDQHPYRAGGGIRRPRPARPSGTEAGAGAGAGAGTRGLDLDPAPERGEAFAQAAQAETARAR